MKRTCVAAFLVCIFIAQFLYAADRQETDIDKTSYNLGVQIGLNYVLQGVDPSVDMIIDCIKNGMENTSPSETDDDQNDIDTIVCNAFVRKIKDLNFTPNFDFMAQGIKKIKADAKEGKIKPLSE